MAMFMERVGTTIKQCQPNKKVPVTALFCFVPLQIT